MIIVAIIILSGCREVSVPKPKGFFRIDMPAREYTVFNGNITNTANLPISFEYPVYGSISLNSNYKSEPGWFNIEFPSYKAKIYLTYKDLTSNLDTLMEETYRLNIKNHITKADAINELVISDPDNRVYGILYDLKGNTATAVQFFITDSISHFLRGSLYFEAEPDPDSLAPVINFFREDIIHIIETTKWKKE
ncbi:MAG: hypothetical protein QG611_719 [Bacteroidota bacterium]|nr:hypothetical protein [Bacteroidota bacterium]